MPWFLIVLAFGQPDGWGSSLTNKHYATQAACLEDAKPRTAALASVGMHGRYLCMYHNEPDRQLARAFKGDF